MVHPPFWPGGAGIPATTPPPPPVKESRQQLSQDLTLAITNRLVPKAREVMERAFWSNTGFEPDWFHLLLALQQEDRKMLNLLLAYGAKMTPAQVTFCASIIPETTLSDITPLLATHGIVPLPAGQIPEGLVIVETLRRLIQESSDTFSADSKKKILQDMDDMVCTAFLDYVEKDDIKSALRVLRLAGQDTQEGIDITAPLRRLLQENYPDITPALALFNTFTREEAPAKIKPVNLEVMDYIFEPRWVNYLGNHGLIGKKMYAGRIDFLRSAFFVSRYKKHDHDMALLHLFNKDISTTETEVEAFLSFHKASAAKDLKVLDELLNLLATRGFFDAPAWTPDKLITLKKQHPMSSPLIDAFNKRAHLTLIKTSDVETFLNQFRIHELIESYRVVHFPASANTTHLILDFFQDLMKNDTSMLDMTAGKYVSPRDFVFPLVAALKNSGADFSTVDPMKYLGKKEPGLAKILLDLEIVKAENFDLHAIRKRNGGKMEIVIPPSDKHYPYTEFMAQIIMGNTDPKKYLSLLHQNRASWQETLRQAITADDKKDFALSINFKRRGTGGTGPR